MQLPVTGRINGNIWREHLDFGEAAELMRHHLGTAAMIICLYLTGIRLQESRVCVRGAAPNQSPLPTAPAVGTSSTADTART